MTNVISVENVTDELNATGTYEEADDSYKVLAFRLLP